MCLKIACRVEHGARFQIGLRELGRQKIGTHSFAQVARFAYVNDAVKSVAHQVNTRFMRDFMYLFMQIRLLFGRYSHSAANLREKQTSGNRYRLPQRYNVRTAKRPRNFSRALLILAEATFPLRPCRCRSSCFLVLVDPGWPAQHHFAHEHPVADSRVIDGRRPIWSYGRPTYGATLWINDRPVSRVVIALWCHIRCSPEHKVIRIRSVRND